MFSLPHLKPISLITCYKNYLWLKRGKIKIPQGKEKDCNLLENKIFYHENNGIFLLHLVLYDTSTCQADATTKLHLPMPCNQQYQALIDP